MSNVMTLPCSSTLMHFRVFKWHPPHKPLVNLNYLLNAWKSFIFPSPLPNKLRWTPQCGSMSLLCFEEGYRFGSTWQNSIYICQCPRVSITTIILVILVWLLKSSPMFILLIFKIKDVTFMKRKWFSRLTLHNLTKCTQSVNIVSCFRTCSQHCKTLSLV